MLKMSRVPPVDGVLCTILKASRMSQAFELAQTEGNAPSSIHHPVARNEQPWPEIRKRS